MGANHSVVTRRRGDAEVPFARMTELPLRPATYEDLLKVPDNLVAELIDGELYTSPRPASRHARTSSILGSKLVGAFDIGHRGPGGFWIVFDRALHVGVYLVGAEAAVWARRPPPGV